MMSQAMRKLAGSIAKSQCVAIFINQLREKGRRHLRQPGGHDRRPRPQVLRLGPHGGPPHGAPQKRHRADWQPYPCQGGQKQGRAPFKEAEFDIMYGQGISRTSELVDLGVKYGLVNKSGAWFSMGDTVWVRAATPPSSISRSIRTSRTRYSVRSCSRSRRSAPKIPQARLSSCPRASRPHRQRSMPHPSRRPPRRFRSTRTILTTSTTKNERG